MDAGVDRALHFARLEQPSQALRTECGTLREPSNWTTVRKLVTCPRCRELLQLPPLEHGLAPGATGGR